MSTAAALGKFRLYAEEFDKRTNSQVEAMLADVALRLDLPSFGARAPEAVARLAAHEFEMIARRKSSPAGWGSVGPVRSVSSEAVSMVVGEGKAPVNSHEADEYGQTSHGRAFLQIRASRSIGFGVLV